MITSLVLFVCLSADPSVCKEVKINTGEITSYQCMLYAQQAAAEWQVRHPKYKINGIKCRVSAAKEVKA